MPRQFVPTRYSFIVLAEAATNIATHLCARLLKKAPSTYAESFAILADQKLIDPSLAARLGKMMGFCNLLIHGYGKIDDKKMLQIMRGDLKDVEQYLSEVERLVRACEGGAENGA
ncbi:MAG: type VII toxin-antitoxin system HepT family RNase toxin [Desulfotomaculales bacterium]